MYFKDAKLKSRKFIDDLVWFVYKINLKLKFIIKLTMKLTRYIFHESQHAWDDEYTSKWVRQIRAKYVSLCNMRATTHDKIIDLGRIKKVYMYQNYAKHVTLGNNRWFGSIRSIAELYCMNQAKLWCAYNKFKTWSIVKYETCCFNYTRS
jgi:hypothetical protein